MDSVPDDQNIPVGAGVSCSQCSRMFSSTVALGRHARFSHRNLRAPDAVRTGSRSGTSLYRSEDFPPEIEDELLDVEVPQNVADTVFSFFDHFRDSSLPVFSDVTPLSPPLELLCGKAKSLLMFCCQQKFSTGEIGAQYDHEVTSAEHGCGCTDAFREQFPSRISFASYVSRARRLYSASQGWRHSEISTEYGVNRTGVFRSVVELARSEVSKAGGTNCIIPYRTDYINGRQIFSSPINSNSMGKYEQSNALGAKILAFDLYADGTTLAKSGSQSACLLRVRFVNMKGRSIDWHEIGIAPTLRSDTSYTDSKMTMERMMLLQRYLFMVLRDVFVASKSGIFIDGHLVLLRINSIVADQKQERSFFCLRAAGSFMDCSNCTMPSRRFSPRQYDSEPNGLAPDEIYARQTDPLPAAARCVADTVWRQVIVAKARLTESHQTDAHAQIHDRRFISMCKRYLERHSAVFFPPALAACYGFGTEPSQLYDSIGFDRLHAFDLGAERDIPDMAHRLFKSAVYNKGLITKAKLVRLANQRFRDLPRVCGLYVAPFRSGDNEVHANMTGKLRRKITPYLWVVLMGLQPQTRPDDDILLQAALSLNHVQILLRGINLDEEAGLRTEEDIGWLENLCFNTGLYVSKALGIPINTKLHRLMRHVGFHMRQFGCARRGETDHNETLHKLTKRCYPATNHKGDQIAKQLLTVRSIADAVAFSDIEGIGDEGGVPSFEQEYISSIVVNAEPLQQFTQPPLLYSQPDVSPEKLTEFDYLAKELQCHLQCIPNIEHAANVVSSIMQPSTHSKVWTVVKSVKFNATLPWIDDQNSRKVDLRQIAYAGGSINGKGPRYDAVEYLHEGTVRRGFLHLIADGRLVDGSKVRTAVIRRLRLTEPEEGNEKVVEYFGNLRYAYECDEGNGGDAILDCVTQRDLRRVLVIVPDMYDIVKRHDISTPLSGGADTIQERRLSRFFAVQGVQVTSIPISDC